MSESAPTALGHPTERTHMPLSARVGVVPMAGSCGGSFARYAGHREMTACVVAPLR